MSELQAQKTRVLKTPNEGFLVLSRDVTEIVHQERLVEYEARLNAAVLEVESNKATEDGVNPAIAPWR